MAERETWAEHCKKEHPGRVRWGVRNLAGTRYMCCIGDCEWEMKRD